MLITLPELLRQHGHHAQAERIERDAESRAILLGIGGDKFTVEANGTVRAMSKSEAEDWLDALENQPAAACSRS